MPIDGRIKACIQQQVGDGILNVAEVQRHAESFVKHQLFMNKRLPSRLNRRFFPTRRDIMNIIYRARGALMHSKVDQENLIGKISDWVSDDSGNSFLLRPYTENDSTGSDYDDGDVLVNDEGNLGLLIVHQTTWQKRLLCKYGKLCLLDATYKTSRYAVPLFFLCVRTNVDYVVVATFVLQYEDCRSIAEALKVIASWNPTWSPDAFMVDYCEAEIKAIEEVFTGLLLLLITRFYNEMVNKSCMICSVL